MTPSNPTPTPLASTAMAAARELLDAQVAFFHSQGVAVSHVHYEQDLASHAAAILQKHFQPLLAKVEDQLTIANGFKADVDAIIKERDTANILLKTTRDQLEARERIGNATEARLRADLAAKEAALGLVLPYAQMLFEGRKPYGAGADVLPCIIADARSALASRADKGGAR